MDFDIIYLKKNMLSFDLQIIYQLSKKPPLWHGSNRFIAWLLWP